MKLINVEVITPSKSAYNNEVVSVTVPGSKGNFQVLYNHAPILSSLEIGKIKIMEQGEKERIFATGGGMIEVLDNRVLILVESFESADEIDVERAERALKRAKERLAHKNDPNIDVARAEAALKRAMNRLKIAGRVHVN